MFFLLKFQFKNVQQLYTAKNSSNEQTFPNQIDKRRERGNAHRIRPWRGCSSRSS